MFNFDKRILYLIIGGILIFTIANMTSDGLLTLLLTIPGVLIAITFHEFAHAYTAYKLGDNTPMYQGRINLNPANHVDPIGLIVLIVANFGWGKPVEINPRNFGGKYSLSASEAIVAVAGPIMNFIVAIVFAILLGLFSTTLLTMQNGDLIFTILQYTVIVNIGLGIFNLIPLPPLDGSKVLMHFLPYNAKVWFQNNAMTFYFVFIILFVTGIAGMIISPLLQSVYYGLMSFIGMIF